MARVGNLEGGVAAVGARVIGAVAGFGHFSSFVAYTLSFVPGVLLAGWRLLIPQFYSVGAMSVPVVMLTGAFVGMVLIVQGWDQFENANLTDRLGGIVNISIAAELGPVLAGVMLAGRVGGALTAELGTMNVTEQLLALRSMGTDPVRYLATPRFLACLLLTPLLTLYANLMGALGSWVIFCGVYAGDSEPFWRNSAEIVEMWDIGSGLVKAFFFGGAIGLIACFKGFSCRGGAEGVGRACTEAFVASFIVILVLDLFLNFAINGLYRILYGFRMLF
ncbi:MAG: ABC transporter permease [Phycisphaerae bacterium]|nr:ABC transporter permease [Phycisphaerae bacterium]MCZ2398403.1 ABC transporter permease [Phycisphaerae bacterium]NUQ50161.1 ABC transporter permease [Phycisphaerae bacterium]